MLLDYDIITIATNYEALILICGMIWGNKDAQQIKPLVGKCLEDGKILGGICDASAFSGVTGFLNHVRHTSNVLTI